MLIAQYTTEEVVAALKDIGPTKASNEDDFLLFSSTVAGILWAV